MKVLPKASRHAFLKQFQPPPGPWEPFATRYAREIQDGSLIATTELECYQVKEEWLRLFSDTERAGHQAVVEWSEAFGKWTVSLAPL